MYTRGEIRMSTVEVLRKTVMRRAIRRLISEARMLAREENAAALRALALVGAVFVSYCESLAESLHRDFEGACSAANAIDAEDKLLALAAS